MQNKNNLTALKKGLSGIIRAKNESKFIETCIDSCIDSVDELIVVYNDCTDSTEQILVKKVNQYPNKLKIYAYNNNILSHNLSKEEFDYAINLPENSPRLHSTQCNFALSKVTYEYAMKIDPDQVYYPQELKKWRDICAGDRLYKWEFSFLIAWLFMAYISLYRRISSYTKHPCIKMIPDKLITRLKKCYQKYISWRLQKGTAAISFSGVNVYYANRWFVTFDKFNHHPPYNGEGDTLLFKVSDKTKFCRYYDNNKQPYSVIESFKHPYKVILADAPLWFHLHANRDYCTNKVLITLKQHSELFIKPDDFVNMTGKELSSKMDSKEVNLYQRTLFSLIHILGINTVKDNLPILQKIKIKDVI